MKRMIYDIIWLVPATLLAGLMLPSCVYDSDQPVPGINSASIRVNTKIVDSSRSDAGAEEGDNTFMVLLWNDYAHLSGASATATWPAPYIAGHAPQPVPFYEHTVYDLRYPYPDVSSYIFATGYAPGAVLQPGHNDDYSRLVATVSSVEKGRYDFLGCDLWPEVYRGSQENPFAQDMNKLYFRHLAAKLMFYADRDKESMENKQFVRNVQITKLYMSTDGGTNWTAMQTPSQFKWGSLTDGDFTSSYNKTIDAVKAIDGNSGRVTTKPLAGYHVAAAESFAGDDAGFVLQRNAADRVPVYGMKIDSCYVCNPIDGKSGDPIINESVPIRLKMDISAELSFSFDFPLGDETSDTDNLTYTRTWPGVELGAIYEVNDKGEADKGSPVTQFKPGSEYRVYIHFSRTGVNLVALELPWNYGGVHYITIPGGNQTTTKP